MTPIDRRPPLTNMGLKPAALTQAQANGARARAVAASQAVRSKSRPPTLPRVSIQEPKP